MNLQLEKLNNSNNQIHTNGFSSVKPIEYNINISTD